MARRGASGCESSICATLIERAWRRPDPRGDWRHAPDRLRSAAVVSARHFVNSESPSSPEASEFDPRHPRSFRLVRPTACSTTAAVRRRVRCAAWCVVTTQSRRAGDRPSRRRSHAALHQRVKPPPGESPESPEAGHHLRQRCRLVKRGVESLERGSKSAGRNMK